MAIGIKMKKIVTLLILSACLPIFSMDPGVQNDVDNRIFPDFFSRRGNPDTPGSVAFVRYGDKREESDDENRQDSDSEALLDEEIQI